MTYEQAQRVAMLHDLGGTLDTETGLVLVWLNGHCFMITEDGKVQEL